MIAENVLRRWMSCCPGPPRDGGLAPAHTEPAVTRREAEVAFLIADLAGYTALTAAHGGLEAAKVVGRYVELAEGALVTGARIAERVGDELLVVADEPHAVVRSAIRLRDAIESEPMFPGLRAGIHMGRVVREADRYFGPALNLTARIATHAHAGQMFCTETVAQACSGLGGVEWRPIGTVRFKNVPEPVSLLEVVTASSSAPVVAIDPVCRMQVRPEAAPARLPYGGTTYCFCSFECAKAFADHPENYPTVS
jgi:class 3 adenylate cyclase